MYPPDKNIAGRHFVIITAWVTILTVFSCFSFTDFRVLSFDAPSYIGGSRLLFDLPGGFNFQGRISKPIPLILPGLLEYCFHITPSVVFQLQQYLSYAGCGIFLYLIIHSLTRNRANALWISLVYVSCEPLFFFSSFILSDLLGWFLMLAGVYLFLGGFRDKSNLKIFFSGIITALGLLSKESAGLAVVFVSLVLLMSPGSYKNKLQSIVIYFFGTGLLLLMANGFIMYRFNYSLLSRINEGHHDYGFSYYTLSDVKMFGKLLGVFWVLVLPVVYTKLKSAEKQNFILNAFGLTALVCIVILPLLWPAVVDRILFMFIPFLLIYIADAKEFSTNSKKISVLIASGALMNIILSITVTVYHMRWTFAIFIIIFMLILKTTLFKRIKKTI